MKENKRLLPPPLPNHQENPTKPQTPLTIRRSNKSSPMPLGTKPQTDLRKTAAKIEI